MFDNIASARKHQGILCGGLTCIERDIANLEAKEELTQQDQQKAERSMDQIKALKTIKILSIKKKLYSMNTLIGWLNSLNGGKKLSFPTKYYLPRQWHPTF